MDQFHTYRYLLFSIAYRMTGSASQAEDIVQDAYLRYQQVAASTIHSLQSYLTAIVVNLSLNYLKSAHVQREEYVGIWLPEPIYTSSADSDSPEVKFEQQESLSMAFLVLLEALTPPERAVFLLHEIFDYPFAEIAEILEKSPASCRQIFHRAKSHITEKRQRTASSTEVQHQLMTSFMAACQSGNLATLTHLLASDATAWADGGGKARASLYPVTGREIVAKLFIVLASKVPAASTLSIEEVNGTPAIVCWSGSQLTWVLLLDVYDNVIVGLYSILNPDKLAFLQHQLQRT